jgi:hypothetical protein
MVETNNQALTSSLMDAVTNFGVAYAATKELLQSSMPLSPQCRGKFKCCARCQAIGYSQLPPNNIQYQQQQLHCPRGQGRSKQQGGSRGISTNGVPIEHSSGSYNNNTDGSCNNNGNSNMSGSGSSGFISARGYNGCGGYGGSNGGNQQGHTLPSKVKHFENWHYCHTHTHGGNVDNIHTSTTCASPGENYQHAATHTDTMGRNT